MITAARLTEILDELVTAGDDWPTRARKLPEFGKLSTGKPTGPGLHRPWVLLNGEHEHFDNVPVRLVMYEDGTWFLKGTVTIRQLEDG